MARTVNRETIDLVKRLEGLRLTAYPDPGSKDGHPWSIGYGHTSDGFMKVQRGLTITPQQAEEALAYDLNETAAKVDALVKVQLSDNQFGALVSFAFNVGFGDKKTPGFGNSTLLKKLNKGDYASVPGEMARWHFNDGKPMDGLVTRRAAEAGLWAKGEFASSKHVDATAAPPVTVTKENVSWAATIGSSLLASVSGGMNSPITWVFAAIMAVSFGVALYLFLSKRLAPK